MRDKLHVLYLEDSIKDCELIRQLLMEDGIECELQREETRSGFTQELEHQEYDLIFADYTLPQFTGLEALRLARDTVPETPFIFVSGTMGEETAIESLRSGATDYVLKERLSRLVPAVRRALAEKNEKIKNREMEQRLRQAQRLEAVGTLASGVAHDFNNILTIIKGHLALLAKEGSQPERVREIGATIDRAAQRGTNLVEQLLAFVRKSEGSFTSVNINQQVREIVTMLRQAFPNNITFQTELDAQLPEILADPGQLEQVIINLATNARDAMPDGGTIAISTKRVQGDRVPFVASAEPEHPHVCLKVTDTGVGMDEATRQHIFEPFFTTKPKGKGTGLGMWTVYGLMQSHNGVVDIQSEKGKGTTVSLFFPVPEAAAVSAKRPEQQAQPSGGTETVLIVDDESDVRYFLQLILEMNGYKVLAAANAEEALGILKERGGEIDLLFSDLSLSKMDGFALSEEVRKLYPRIKIILASGYVDMAIKTRMTELGLDGFISKPYETSALMETLRSILDKK
ncbi:MAG TPA: response regulator [Candidatus Methylacidiphilales bacterium]|nr:response regulator [Candidatus Methylacidiphilales bacterium]